MTKQQTNSWEEELKEIIDGDWELMELNPGRPYRTGVKEVHFIKLKVFISQEKEKCFKETVKAIFSGGTIEYEGKFFKVSNADAFNFIKLLQK